MSPSLWDGVISHVFSGLPVGAQLWGLSGAEHGVGGCGPECPILSSSFVVRTREALPLPQGVCVWGALSLLPGGPQECSSKGSPVLQTMLTAISMSAIATNGVVPGKGCWQPGHLKRDFL